MKRILSRSLILALAATAAQAQTINTYTQSQTGPNLLTYGLPVPLPIESLTPVDGFRSYASLDARLQGLALSSADLSAHDVGDTHAGRTIWAYVASDADGVDVEGRPEAAFFINAATHAREWAAPEVSAGTIERLVAGANDGGLIRYLLDNTRAVIIPVQNIDGFLQTQRYPTQAIVGGDPDSPSWPRDGRMRRKNMPNVDEVLTTFADRLGGVDLNRNHEPFWATLSGQGSSPNPNSLTYHGTAPHSEPENVAIERAAELGPVSRMRLGIDLHSFSRVFFSSNTARVQLNNIQSTLIQKLRLHHLALSGKNYTDVPDPPNQGIGTASEYFAYKWLVPSWTLELEPQNSPVEYGGLNVNHGGFILPASEARRVRESWAETHAIAFYIMSGPPHLARVRIYRVDSGAMTLDSKWTYQPASGNRVRSAGLSNPLVPMQRYRIELAFNKPMRYRDPSGQITALPGSAAVPVPPSVAFVRDGARVVLDTSQGEWVTDPARVMRYRDDTFAFEFDAPAELADYRLEVSAVDFAAAQLDADPSSPADWSDGSWSQFEGANGQDGIAGGPDATLGVRVATQSPSQVQIVGPALMGEGDLARVTLTRPAPDARAVEIRHPLDEAWFSTSLIATWGPNEGGERTILVGHVDDVAPQGDRDVMLALGQSIDGVAAPDVVATVRVLDNDRQDVSVVRATPRVDLGHRLKEAFDLSNASTAPGRAIVMDGGLEYFGPSGPTTACVSLDLSGPQVVYGNHSFLGRGLQTCGRALAYFGEPGPVDLRDMTLSIRGPGEVSAPTAAQKGTLSDSGLLVGTGDLVLRRVVLESGPASTFGVDDQTWALSHETGTVRVERSRIEGFDGPTLQAAIRMKQASAALVSSTTRDTAARYAWSLENSSLAIADSTSIASDATSGFATGASGGSLSSTHALLQAQTALCGGTIASTSGARNLVSDASCGLNAPTDIVSRLAPIPQFDEGLGGFRPAGFAVDGGGTSCGAVDQRGAPRPQTLTPGATPRCDIGAIELGVNPYRGAWSAERNGHGVDIQTTGNQLFMIWYTYQDDGQPTAYSAIAPLTGKHWETDLRLTSRNPQSGAITTVNVGRVTLDFESDVDARLGWRFDTRGTTGSERIRPSQATLGEPRFEATGLWSAPGDGGYGVNVVRIGQVTGATAYYYDAQGIQRWALGVSNDADATEFQMTSFTGFCPDCDAATNPVVGQPAGKLLIHFHTPQRARMDLQLAYPGANGGTWNRTGTLFVPLNDPVDNRAARAALGD